MDFGRYSKLIGALSGNLIAIILVYLGTQGLAECTVGPDGTEACALLGFSGTTITATVMTIINAYFVYAFPANQPPA